MTKGDVYGVISLVAWSLTLMVSIKFVTFVMRADNEGEGGVMALFALLRRADIGSRRVKLSLLTAGLVGVALFYADGMLTPAISVLSAVEGIEVAAPSLSSIILPCTIAVVVGLFAIQRHGTAIVGRLFAPIIGLWFAALAAAGIAEIVKHPDALLGLSPTYAVEFFAAHPLRRSSRSARSSSSSPARKRCTRTWATSAAARSAGPGSSSRSRR